MRTGKGWPAGLRRKWKRKPMRGKASEPEVVILDEAAFVSKDEWENLAKAMEKAARET